MRGCRAAAGRGGDELPEGVELDVARLSHLLPRRWPRGGTGSLEIPPRPSTTVSWHARIRITCQPCSMQQ